GDGHDHVLEAVFDALGDFDFAFAGQQFDRSHFAHVHADGIGGAAKVGIDRGQGRLGFVLDVIVVGCDRRIVVQQQRFGIGRLVVDRDAHVAEGADDAVDGLGVDQVVRQVVVDLAIGEIAALFAELDENLEAVAARLLFFRGHLAAGGRVFVALASLAATLGHGLEIGDDFGFDIDVVIGEVGRIIVGRLGRTAGTASGGCGTAGLGCFFGFGPFGRLD